MELEFQRIKDKEKIHKDEIMKSIRKLVKSYGMKFYHGYIYTSEGEYFFKMHFYNYIYTKDETETTNVRTIIGAKTLESDVMFWNITDMKDNLNLPERYRADGYFTVPTFKFEEKSFEMYGIEEVEKVCRSVLSYFQEIINNFIQRFADINSFYTYISEQSEFTHDKLIKMLLLIQMERYDEAFKMVTQELQKGKRGYFSNENKDIYEYIKEYCENIIGIG
jgi:hypothetical protein